METLIPRTKKRFRTAPEEKKCTNTLSIKISSEDLQELERVSKDTSLTKGEIIRRSLLTFYSLKA